ncbi:MAG: DUF3558 family protein [Pseudonocardiaceae bacterium]
MTLSRHGNTAATRKGRRGGHGDEIRGPDRLRPGLVALVAVAGALAGGCSGSFSVGSFSDEVGDASAVDMCSILTDEEFSGLGINPGSRTRSDDVRTLGCEWTGTPFNLRMARNDSTIADILANRDNPVLTSVTENTVNGRSGIRLTFEGSAECEQRIDGGPKASLSVDVLASSQLGPSIDPCAEALRIAELIEPKLP